MEAEATEELEEGALDEEEEFEEEDVDVVAYTWTNWAPQVICLRTVMMIYSFTNLGGAHAVCLGTMPQHLRPA